MCGGQQTATRSASLVFARGQVLADEMMKFRRAQSLLKRVAATQRAIKAVRAEQVFIVEHDVVDADNAVFAQLQVVESRPRLVHVHSQGEVGVVIQIRSGANNPVDETCLYKGNEARGPQSRRR